MGSPEEVRAVQDLVADAVAYEWPWRHSLPIRRSSSMGQQATVQVSSMAPPRRTVGVLEGQRRRAERAGRAARARARADRLDRVGVDTAVCGAPRGHVQSSPAPHSSSGFVLTTPRIALEHGATAAECDGEQCVPSHRRTPRSRPCGTAGRRPAAPAPWGVGTRHERPVLTPVTHNHFYLVAPVGVRDRDGVVNQRGPAGGLRGQRIAG